MILNLEDFYKQSVSKSSVIEFFGNVTPKTISSFVGKMEGGKEKSRKVRKKLVNVCIESLQNLYHHTDKPGASVSDSVSTCIIDENEVEYSIITGNYIDTNKIEAFKDHLDKLNTLNKEELRKYYLETLNNGIRSEHDGAGLGMIEIARKTDEKLHYNFIITRECTLFVLNLKILKQND